jgi:hypothetical protein
MTTAHLRFAVAGGGGGGGGGDSPFWFAVGGKTLSPPRAPFFLEAWGTSRFPTPLPAHSPKIGE